MNPTPSKPHRLLWITPEVQGGIASYSQMLWPAIAAAATAAGDFAPLTLLQTAPVARSDAISAVRDLQPDLVHVQHEYGLFGGTNPFLDGLPRWMRQLRRAVPPTTRIVATAHTVLPKGHRFETRGQGWRGPLNWMANATALPWMHRRWREGTWGRFDGVIAHSAMQVKWLQGRGLPAIVTIPHVVPEIPSPAGERPRNPIPRITVFGYFCPVKGQDVVIEALRHVRDPVLLRLAGGVRHPMNDGYHERCRRSIVEFGLGDRVEVTGFVPEADISQLFLESDLVVAPFRMTTGSGSLVQALARGAAVLASDLPLNREINERVPDTLAFFATEDPRDCARQIERLLADQARRDLLGRQALQYAAAYSPPNIARLHLDMYRDILAR
jgi:glycosyltransferase involved in cell wall biosynthesis